MAEAWHQQVMAGDSEAVFFGAFAFNRSVSHWWVNNCEVQLVWVDYLQ